MRKTLAKPFWFIADHEDWFNRVGCYIAFGRNWRTKNDSPPYSPPTTSGPYLGSAYCVKCKENVEFTGIIRISDSGRRMAQGKCPRCGTKVNRILGKAD